MIFYVAGILAGAFLPELPRSWLWLVLAPLFLCGPWRRCSMPFWLGVLVAISYGHWQLWHRLDPVVQERDQRLLGMVTGLPKRAGEVQRFELRVLEPRRSRLRRVSLGLYEAAAPLRPGDIVALEVRLKPPRSLWNPAAFDYERWALSRDIDATGYVRGEIHRLGQRPTLDRLRAVIAERLAAAISDPKVAALTQALLVGDRRGLGEADWQRLRRTGTVHLLVVSGLHIGILVGFGWLLGRGLCWLWPARRLPPILPRLLPTLLALSLSGLYVLLAGAGLATQRAWIMAAVLLLSAFWLVPIPVWRRWWLALCLVLTLQPLAVLEPGLWLSFGAVAALLLLSQDRGRQPLWTRLVRAQLAIFCLMTPLLLGAFAQLSLIGPLVNLVAIPLLPLLILGLIPVLFGAWAGFGLPGELYGALVGGLWHGLGVVADWQGSASLLAVPSRPLLGLALAAAAVVVLPLALQVRALALGIWALALFALPQPGNRDDLRAWVFDVGQGTSVLVESAGRRLLYDTGPAYLDGGTAFERAVLPWLQQRGVHKLDRLVLSHADSDHAGGRHRLRQQLDVGRRESGSGALQAEEGYQPCRAGQQWHWGPTRFRYLHGGGSGDENDRSCVLLVESGGCRLLLTGDIGAGVEGRLVAEGALPRLTWLVASHHGSRSSSTPAFVQAAAPELVLFSAGYLNRYGHPAPAVVERFRQRGANTLTTAHSGAIELRARGGECRERVWRRVKKRYWSAG